MSCPRRLDNDTLDSPLDPSAPRRTRIWLWFACGDTQLCLWHKSQLSRDLNAARVMPWERSARAMGSWY